VSALIATVRYVLLTAYRDRLALVILAAQLTVLAGSELVATAALSENIAVGLVTAGAMMRAVMVLGLITFVSFHARRMEETREIEVILTRPISRPAFVLAYFAAYSGLALLLALPAGLLLGAGYGSWTAGLAEWQASLMLESLVLVALSLFCALSLGSATASVMAASGLYLMCRLGAYFRAISEQHTGMLDHPAADKVARLAIEIVSALLPRLDLFGQGSWLVYGPGGGWGLGTLAAQTLVTVAVLLLATIRDVNARRF